MKIRNRGFSRVAAILVCVMLVVSGPSVNAMSEEATLEGVIEAVEYDEDGEVVTVTIYDSEWGAVLISNEGKGKELLDHVGAFARVTGEVEETTEDEEFRYVLLVDSYEIDEAVEPDENPTPKMPTRRDR